MDTVLMTFEIFVDLDGVLADMRYRLTKICRQILGDSFVHRPDEEYDNDPEYRELMHRTIATYQNEMKGQLWLELPLMKDAIELWDYVIPHQPTILSATGHPDFGAAGQKYLWVATTLGEDVPVILTEKAREKARHAASNRILIDDKPKAINPWIEAGGIGILHTSATNTISQLKSLGVN